MICSFMRTPLSSKHTKDEYTVLFPPALTSVGIWKRKFKSLEKKTKKERRRTVHLPCNSFKQSLVTPSSSTTIALFPVYWSKKKVNFHHVKTCVKVSILIPTVQISINTNQLIKSQNYWPNTPTRQLNSTNLRTFGLPTIATLGSTWSAVCILNL